MKIRIIFLSFIGKVLCIFSVFLIPVHAKAQTTSENGGKDLTFFENAIRKNQIELVKLYLTLGYDPNHEAKISGTPMITPPIRIPLHIAIIFGRHEIVNLLLYHNADLTQEYITKKPVDLALSCLKIRSSEESEKNYTAKHLDKLKDDSIKTVLVLLHWNKNHNFLSAEEEAYAFEALMQWAENEERKKQEKISLPQPMSISISAESAPLSDMDMDYIDEEIDARVFQQVPSPYTAPYPPASQNKNDANDSDVDELIGTLSRLAFRS